MRTTNDISNKYGTFNWPWKVGQKNLSWHLPPNSNKDFKYIDISIYSQDKRLAISSFLPQIPQTHLRSTVEPTYDSIALSTQQTDMEKIYV